MIPREIAQSVSDMAQKIGVISIMGPRQSGKTTLAKNTFPNHTYYNLEDLRTQELIRHDPMQFIKRHTAGIIFDEIQKYPELLSSIQVNTDEDFSPGRFIITGSENLLLSEKVSQTLAGRVAIFQLLPLSIHELRNAGKAKADHFSQILSGFYPRIYDQDLYPRDLYPDYVATYIERDVRQIKNIHDLSAFRRVLQLLAGRAGHVLNMSDLGSDAGVNYKTIEAWISILEATYIIFRLQPYYDNFGKRIIKSPKVYFYDTGLLAYLLGIDSEHELQTHFALGNMFENMIVADIQKQLLHSRSSSRIYFWRDSEKNEIDLLIQNGAQIYPVEIKAGSSFASDYLKGIDVWNSFTSEKQKSYVVYSGKNLEISGTYFLNWADLSEVSRVLVDS